MRRGFGIGLLLLASALLLVTLGVTLTVPGSIGFLESLEIVILLIIQLAIILLLFTDKKWGVSHFIVFVVAIVGILFAIMSYLQGTENLGVLAVIALNLLGFVIAIFGATESEPKVPRRQTSLETFSVKSVPSTQVYDVEEIVKKAEEENTKTAKKSSKKRGRPKGSTKKSATKTAKKSSKKRGRPKGSTKKAAKTTKKADSTNDSAETYF